MSSTAEFAIERAQVRKSAPDLYAGLSAAQKAVHDSGLEAAMLEIVKVRVSQLNGCAFCVEMHTAAAREAGVSWNKLLLIPVWREAGQVFSERERAALRWADAVTDVESISEAPDAVYADLQAAFTEREIVYLTAAIALIGTWNRIAKPLRFGLVATPFGG